MVPFPSSASFKWNPDPLAFSLAYLSTELLSLIFEELLEIDPHSAWTARLACRRLECVGTPILYKMMLLSERKISVMCEQHVPSALEKMYAHTRYLVGYSNLDPVRMKTIVERIKKLVYFHFSYVDGIIKSGEFYLPGDIIDIEKMQRDEIRLLIENLPLRNFDLDEVNLYRRAFPIRHAKHIIHLNVAPPTTPLVTRLRSLYGLLLTAPDLEVLQIEDRGQGTQFEFGEGNMLPTLRELCLRSYDWRHTRDDMDSHWALHKLVRLELISVPVFNFLIAARFPQLGNLKILRCDDFSAHLPDCRRQATDKLVTLVRDNIKALEVLCLTLHMDQFPPVDVLRKHGPTLRELRLRDHVGFSEENRGCPTLCPTVVAALSRTLPRLEELELDMDLLSDRTALRFLDALVLFPRLHTITLHVQTRIRLLAEDPMDKGMNKAERKLDLDLDRAHALHIVRYLALNRRRLQNGPLFRNITINVGGWKPVMVRRLSEAWRAMNQKGLFAERCFVMHGGGVLEDGFKEVLPTQVK
ncbi:hypothetical protein M406DRAFT_249530 [Cryphonectria parasitica EP155]|uniref:F-box domain-containing protein n=1 Tax=Cryphonectria parasitica (strain ATCC 38755 / EP155) TaxID=660469 RepID=A0A9P5CSS3_CRYP1|nr:uncharacterized protein M406DRAFT_249530 [Cryphonectria parasitica EP155]KAF3768425.1 hypothetical protein M406DRAFT_249530 [Cryphonectria parasitica EP155]